MVNFLRSIGVLMGSLRFRLFVFQVLVFCGVIGVFSFLISNMFHNMEERGIKTGFDFLGENSGFGISFSLIEYDESHSYARTYLVGLVNTVFVSFFGILFATVLGFFVGVARLSENWLMKKLMAWYIEVFRNLPILLQILFWNFVIKSILPNDSWEISENVYLSMKGLVVPHLAVKDGGLEPANLAFFLLVLFIALGIAWVLRKLSHQQLKSTGRGLSKLVIFAVMFVFFVVISFFLFDRFFIFENPEKSSFGLRGGFIFVPEIFVLIVSLGVYTSSFVAEAVRSGIVSVNVGQKEAALALGLKPKHILNKIIMPQAVPVIIPPCISHFLTLTKNSSLAMAIGFPDLTSVFAGTTLNQVGQVIEIMFMTMFTYLFLSIVVSVFLNWYNSHVKLVQR